MRWGGTFDVDGLERQLDYLTHQTGAEGFWDDPDRAQKLVQERATIEATVERQRTLVRETKDLDELLEMAAADGDESMIDDVANQVPALEKRVRQAELARMLSRPEDRSDAILYIAPGAGGVDAQDWAEMLFRMYSRWCERKGFKTEILDHQAGEEAGIKDASIAVRGPFAYGFLKAENGVHRLIRISPFDSNARRHTAFAAVHVVPEIDDDIEVEIDPSDLRVDVYRASGAGGQHVNKTESAVRITHLPTNTVVQCQNERSQHKNRATAMKQLRAKLYELEEQKRRAEAQVLEDSKTDVGWGQQIRSYVLDQSRVKDLRTGVESGSPDKILDGDLTRFLAASLKQGL